VFQLDQNAENSEAEDCGMIVAQGLGGVLVAQGYGEGFPVPTGDYVFVLADVGKSSFIEVRKQDLNLSTSETIVINAATASVSIETGSISLEIVNREE